MKFLFTKRPLPGDDSANRQSLDRPYYYPVTNFGGTGEVPCKVWEVRAPAQLIVGGGGAINDVNWGGDPYFELASTTLSNNGPNTQVGAPNLMVHTPNTFGNTGAL
jgi:hypothetical protein